MPESVPGPGNATSPEITWKEGSFCDDFLTKTYQKKARVCSLSENSPLRESVQCFGNPHSINMGMCVLTNVVVAPSVLMRAMYDADRPNFEDYKHAISLLRGADTECRDMAMGSIFTLMPSGDYVLKVVKNIAEEGRTQNVSVCEVWINETVFFFTAHRFHIYFRFLDYYNVHKLIGDYRDLIRSSTFRIIRISGSDNYYFPDFDQALFPEAKVQALEDLTKVKTCFREVILVPKSNIPVQD